VDIILRHQIRQLLERPATPQLGSFLNELMVEFLVCKGFVQSETLRLALLQTPRHAFLPDVELRHAYRDQAVATVCDDDGWFESSCSTPSIVCTMIEALQLDDATNILELGAGTGYTSTLMSRCAPHAKIVTLEVLEDVALETKSRLEAMGIDSVDVRAADGSDGSAGTGPYDRIVLACGAKEIPAELVDLLVDGGLLVIPIGSCVFVFEKQGSQLVGRPIILASFIAFANKQPQSTWQTDKGRSILWPQEVPESQRSIGEADHAIDGPEIQSSQIASWVLWSSLQYPESSVILSERDGGWGFGLHDREANSTVICRMEGALSFRHYGNRAESTRFECWGDPKINDRFLDISQQLADLGWPDFDRIAITVDLEQPFDPELQKNQFLVGSHVWSCEILGFEILRPELAAVSEQPVGPAGMNE
jgi:protein-L-isoaspartate(D-aspartate) O-methyltransferase